MDGLTGQQRDLVTTVLRLLGRDNDPEIWAAAARDLQQSSAPLTHHVWAEATAVEQFYRERCAIDQQLRQLAQRRREVVTGLVERRAALLVSLERELAVAVLAE